jgi:AcrR family transcriptional regulator
VRKGAATRGVILEEAGRLARHVGLGGLTIGSLATQTELSKSGLFAHFGSKESLQLQLLEYTSEQFIATVVRPAVKEPRGEPRVRALFENWLRWAAANGGCLLVASMFELDDQPGPVRDRLVRDQRDWLDTIATVFTSGVTEGQFSPEVDPRQFAQDLLGVMLAFHVANRLLADPEATTRARRALDVLLDAAR